MTNAEGASAFRATSFGLLSSFVIRHSSFHTVQLKLDGITKTFGEHRALDGVSLALERAHTLVLIGPSGGGKSTLLRVIAGLEYPDAGAVEINGERAVFDEQFLLAH